MGKLLTVRGVVFDMDGTIAKTEHVQFALWAKTLRNHGVRFGRENYFRYCGKNAGMIEQMLYADYGLELPKGSLLAEKERLLKAHLESKPLRFMPHAKEALLFFRKTGVKMAVCSDNGAQELGLKLSRMGINGFFRAAVTREAVEKGKPYPDCYSVSCNLLDTRREETIAFEDTQNGFIAAKGAYLYTVAIPSEFSALHRFPFADQVCRNFKEVLGILPKEVRFEGA